MTLLLATIGGAAVANLYYTQPLLPEIARHFRTSNSNVALVVTCLQMGYVIGLVFVLPLGDLIRRKPLIITGLLVGSLTLAALVFASSLIEFQMVSLLVGISSVSAQIIVPLAADLAPPNHAGKVVGTITSGILIGILIARTFSGIIADAFGISAIFLFASAAMLASSLILFKVLPNIPAKQAGGKLIDLIKSTLEIFLRHRALQVRAAYGFISFASFTLLWTSLSFYLAGPQYRFKPSVIGAFGLLGVAGALAARFTGSASDKGKVNITTIAGAFTLALGFVIIHFLGDMIAILALGIIMLDAAAMTIHVSNQSVIYKTAPEARSRVNSSYMTIYFLGGSFGSAAAGYAWQLGGWRATTFVGAALGLLLAVLWLAETQYGRSASRA